MPGVNKDQLYDRGLKSVKAMYKSAEKMIKVNSKESGEIQMNCSTAVVLKDKKSGVMAQEGYILYKLKIAFKEGKYKYDFYDFHRDAGGVKVDLEKWISDGNYSPKDRMDERMAFLNEDITKLKEALKEGMKGSKATIKEDW
jgi:hypothetical protein